MNTVISHYDTILMRMIRANVVVGDSWNAIDASLCIPIFRHLHFFLHLIDNKGYQIKVFKERMFTIYSRHTIYILPSSHTATTYTLTNAARKLVVKCV